MENGVIYLNEILDENGPSITTKYRLQIGLGLWVMIFIKMGIRYGDEDSIRLIDNIGAIMLNIAIQKIFQISKKNKGHSQDINMKI